ncbi:MAG: hypothetical protein KME31_25005 [Tolypothrix carrinoi HA7290-LM1]|nr:hypothetical protein [Tolypothrix carrinoi HA7290-LM1]
MGNGHGAMGMGNGKKRTLNSHYPLAIPHSPFPFPFSRNVAFPSNDRCVTLYYVVVHFLMV